MKIFVNGDNYKKNEEKKMAERQSQQTPEYAPYVAQCFSQSSISHTAQNVKNL